MSRTRIVGGTYTKITGGKHNMYSEDDIVFNAVNGIHAKAEEGTIFGSPERYKLLLSQDELYIGIGFQNASYNSMDNILCYRDKFLFKEEQKKYKSDYNLIMENQKLFEMAIALNDNDPQKVEGWDEYKSKGKYYNPFKWYNYIGYAPSEFSTWAGRDKFISINNYVLYKNKIGKSIASKLSANKNYIPSETEIKQMLIDEKKIKEIKNTELGGMIFGNFDFLFDTSKIVVVVRVKFKYQDNIPPNIRPTIRNRVYEAVETYWTESGYKVVGTARGNNMLSTEYYPIYIYIQEVNDDSYHKMIDVEYTTPAGKREVVIRDMNVLPSTSVNTFAHEFGHVLGLYDEYESDGWIEQHMFWKKNEFNNDTTALMCGGSELRDRYFVQYAKALDRMLLEGYSSEKIEYKIVK